MGLNSENGIKMRKRRLKQRLCNRAFVLEFTVLVLTIILFVLLVESYWESPTLHKGRFQNGLMANLKDRVRQLGLVGLSPDEDCKVPRLDPASKPSPDVACRRVKPLQNSCKIANYLFFSKPTDTCPQQDTYDICQIKDGNGKPYVKCSKSVCKRSITIGTVDASQGILVWTKISDIQHLEARIQSLVEQPMEKPNFGFCYIKCSLEDEEEEVVIEEKEEVDEEDRNLFGGMLAEMEALEKESDVYYIYQDSYTDTQYANQAKQLLLLPPQIDQSDVVNNRRRNLLNVNVILLDSVSHSHFLRSMPETVKSLKKIKKDNTGLVFSYNLVQGLKGRTYENVQALFSGELYNPEKPFGEQDLPPNPVHSEVLLKRYKRGGYEITWTEDLCWTWEWGIAKNLVVHFPKEKTHIRWKKLQDALRMAGIDRFDMTLSSCEILKANDHKDPFHGPNAICYNGKYQTQYMLSYLAQLQKQYLKVGKPFFHYTEMNVAHDDYGRRVQTLDEHLAKYFHFVSTQENMITVLYADHGNSYGKYFQKSDEARIEVYHPTLTILASKNLAQILDPQTVQALTVNQDRLVSILDLHYALQTLAPGGSIAVRSDLAQYDIGPRGLLSPINSNRTCSSIPRIQPNVCICEAYDSYVANDTMQLMVAEYALGKINNAIQSQFRAAHPEAETGFGSCQRLVATWFGNVQESINEDTKITKLDLHVPAGKNASQEEDVFFVIIQTSMKTPHLLNLLSYERMSSYSQYTACADAGVNVKLCICSLKQPIIKPDITKIPAWHLNYPMVFGYESTIQNVDNCLYIFEWRTKAGIILQASLECSKSYFTLEVDVKENSAVNVHTSVLLPVRARVDPGEMKFLLVFRQNKASEDWNVEYSIQYKQIVSLV